MPPADLIIFDLDGTLVDSKLDIAHSVNWVLTDLGLTPLPFAKIYQHVGFGVRDLIEHVVGREHADRFDKAMALLDRYYSTHLLDHTALFPGIEEVLESLAGRKLAVISNKPQKHVDAAIRGLGLSGLFGVVFGREAVTRPKPDREAIDTTIDRLAADRARTVMIGDTDIDITAGKRAGITTIGCLFGFGTEQNVRAAKPDFIISDAHELVELLAA